MLNELLGRVQAAAAAFREPELLRDAKRYRYMRNNAAFRDRNGPGLYWYLPRFLGGGEAEQLDKAIDAQLRHNGVVEGPPAASSRAVRSHEELEG